MTNGGAGDREGRGWVQGGGSGGGGSSGRADRPPVICGPGTLSLPWTHLSSRGVGKKRGGDGGDGGGGGGGGSRAENGLQ